MSEDIRSEETRAAGAAGVATRRPPPAHVPLEQLALLLILVNQDVPLFSKEPDDYGEPGKVYLSGSIAVDRRHFEEMTGRGWIEVGANDFVTVLNEGGVASVEIVNALGGSGLCRWVSVEEELPPEEIDTLFWHFRHPHLADHPYWSRQRMQGMKPEDWREFFEHRSVSHWLKIAPPGPVRTR